MVREFRREETRINRETKGITKQIKKMAKEGQPRSSQRILAQQILKKQNMIKKYQQLAAKLEGVKIQIANISTTQTLVDTMKNMAGMLGQTANAVDVNNIQHVITDFNVNLEKQNVMGEMMEDAMDMGDEEIDDADADALIDNIAGDGPSGGGKVLQQDTTQDIDNQLADLKNL